MAWHMLLPTICAQLLSSNAYISLEGQVILKNAQPATASTSESLSRVLFSIQQKYLHKQCQVLNRTIKTRGGNTEMFNFKHMSFRQHLDHEETNKAGQKMKVSPSTIRDHINQSGQPHRGKVSQ